MRLDIEVRSSGRGPRTARTFSAWRDVSLAGWEWVMRASQEIAERWTRIGLDHKGRQKLLCDGVAIIIRRAG